MFKTISCTGSILEYFQLKTLNQSKSNHRADNVFYMLLNEQKYLRFSRNPVFISLFIDAYFFSVATENE